ncbi:type II toxin-antitoxin system Phd/YefM family antitoxin [Streptomyces niveus]|uniref:type II toxin-antitoxin system Phd/YefM family antitoxin n=1 Tax=Streptomyces niveus TaxID=193462 RepID=UPI00367B5EF5
MRTVELTDVVEEFGRLVALIALVEETGERVSVTTDDGEQPRVLLPAAELAELEYWARRHVSDPLPLPDAAPERPPGPERQGPYTRYVQADGVRTTFTRGRAVVVELRLADDLNWLEEQARYGRQGYMEPKQSAAFADFLARQAPVGAGSASDGGAGPGPLPEVPLDQQRERPREDDPGQVDEELDA